MVSKVYYSLSNGQRTCSIGHWPIKASCRSCINLEGHDHCPSPSPAPEVTALYKNASDIHLVTQYHETYAADNTKMLLGPPVCQA